VVAIELQGSHHVLVVVVVVVVVVGEGMKPPRGKLKVLWGHPSIHHIASTTNWM